MDWFLYGKKLRLEKVNALLLAWLLLGYDKTIDLYASKHQRRMLLINILSKN